MAYAKLKNGSVVQLHSKYGSALGVGSHISSEMSGSLNGSLSFLDDLKLDTQTGGKVNWAEVEEISDAPD